MLEAAIIVSMDRYALGAKSSVVGFRLDYVLMPDSNTTLQEFFVMAAALDYGKSGNKKCQTESPSHINIKSASHQPQKARAVSQL